MNKFVLAAGGLAIGLVAVFGLYLFGKGLRNIRMALVSVKWPTVWQSR